MNEQGVAEQKPVTINAGKINKAALNNDARMFLGHTIFGCESKQDVRFYTQVTVSKFLIFRSKLWMGIQCEPIINYRLIAC